MAQVCYPRPLRPGDRIGVTAPSAGVNAALGPRLRFVLEWLTQRGYEPVVGDCMDGENITSAPPAERAAELTRMLSDPGIAAVVPPWGGELLVEILPHLDFEAIAAAEPTWVVGYSDTSTLLLALTTLTGVATVHGQNLMEAPNQLPEGFTHWLDTVGTVAGARLDQCASRTHRAIDAGSLDFTGAPTRTEVALDAPGHWRSLQPLDAGPLEFSGRLIGGCIETLATIAGSPYGNVRAFARQYAPEGLIVYVEASDSQALDIARNLWSLRLAGWFEHANGVLIGRTHAPAAAGGFTQLDAVRSAMEGLEVPVILDVDCGHVPPQLALVNGARASVVLDASTQTIHQTLD